MNGKFLKLIALLLVVLMTMGIAAGCSGKDKTGETKQGATTKASTTKGATTTAAATTTIDKSPTLVVLKWLNSNVSTNFENYGDTEFAKEREKRTGIKAEYISALGTEQVTVLLSSGEYFDIYDFGMSVYPGGAPGMYKDGLSILLNDVKEYAPNYFRFFRGEP
jgi:ABC-type glycerol-3-phosphate transport system substrate-binding protein